MLFMAIIFILLQTACSTTPSSHFLASSTSQFKPPEDKAPLKVAVLPFDVALYQKSASLRPVLKEDWTENAKTHLRTHLIDYFEDSDWKIDFVPESSLAQNHTLKQYSTLYEAVLESIFTYEFGNQRLPIKNKANVIWTLGDSANQISELEKYDYALFIKVHDTYSTTGSIITSSLFNVGMIALTAYSPVVPVGVPILGLQSTYTSIVDLKTGDIIWFDSMGSKSGDLRTEEEAIRTVRAMFKRFPLKQ